MRVPPALAAILDVILGLRPARVVRAEQAPFDDAAIAYQLFREGFDSRDIARGLDLPEWRVLGLLAEGRARFFAGSPRPSLPRPA